MENNNIKVSVIMPVFNPGQFLKTAVDSVLSQSLKDIELILVNDGSTDGSSENCDEYAKIDERVFVIHKKNGGVCKARNSALSIAKGQYIAFADHDDKYLPDLLMNAYNKALSCDADVVKYEKKTFIIKGGQILKSYQTNYQLKVYDEKEIIEHFFELFNLGAFIDVWDGLFKRDFLIDNGIKFDPFFKFGGEDKDFMWKVASKVKRIATIPDIYYYHYARQSFSTSYKFSFSLIESTKEFPCRFLNTLNILGIDYDKKFHDDFNYYLLDDYFFPIINLYSSSECILEYKNKIADIIELQTKDYVPNDILKQSFLYIFKRSKKRAFAYILYKYRLYGLLFIIFRFQYKHQLRIS